MPTYDYECQACGETVEIFHPMSEEPRKKCPSCGKLKLKRQLGAGAGFLFKGSGFYITDYRSDDYKKKAKAESDKSSSASSESKKSSGEKSASGGDKKSSGDSSAKKADSASKS